MMRVRVSAATAAAFSVVDYCSLVITVVVIITFTAVLMWHRVRRSAAGAGGAREKGTLDDEQHDEGRGRSEDGKRLQESEGERALTTVVSGKLTARDQQWKRCLQRETSNTAAPAAAAAVEQELKRSRTSSLCNRERERERAT